MNNLQKTGGVAALLHSAAYLIGIVLYFTMMSPIIDAPPDQYLVMLADYQTSLYVWIFIAYLVSGFCLVAVALALNERFKGGSPAFVPISTVLGLIWACLIIGSGNLMLFGFGQIADIYAQNPAQAETVLLALGIVENGITSGTEFIGGVWALLISIVALQTGKLPKLLNYFGLVIGFAGIVSVIPPLTEMGATFFGLSMIFWFAWVGIVMLRDKSSVVATQPDAAVAHTG